MANETRGGREWGDLVELTNWLHLNDRKGYRIALEVALHMRDVNFKRTKNLTLE